MTPKDLQARVLYRDGSILVIDKPAGLAVHPGPSTPESLERYLPALRFGIRDVPRLVHRLDRDTSGCLALARHARGASKLGRLSPPPRSRRPTGRSSKASRPRTA